MGIEGQTNTRLGAYFLGDVIGRGGMGVVYRARHVHLGREVALKLLAPELSGNEEFRRRFLRESRLAASLDHPNVITVYDAGESDGTLYIAMRYVEGVDLARFLHDQGPLEPLAALSLLDQVAAALDAAHEHDLIHRDVKPANVMIASGWCYLTDFGLTKQTSAAGPSSGLTGAGSVLGTLNYTAPEQIKGREITASVDLYALGCVLQECLTGAPPFTKDTEVALLYAHLIEPPPPPSELRPDLPPAIDDVMAKALAKSPAERYRTCGEFMAAARAALTQEIEPTIAAQAPAPPTVAAAAPTVAGEPTGAVAGGEARPLARRRRLTRFIRPTASRARKQGDTGTLPNSSAGTDEQDVPTIVQPARGEQGSEVAEAGRPGALGRRGSRRLLILLAAGAAIVAAGVVGVEVASSGGGRGQSTGGQRMLTGAIPVGNSPDGITFSHGIMWVANAGDGTITRIDEKSGHVLGRVRYASDSGAAAPIARWHGSIWVGNSRDGVVDRINPVTGKMIGRPIPVAGQPDALTVAFGDLWFANSNGTIARFVKGSTEPTVIHGLPSGPKWLAGGSNGTLWVANQSAGTVTPIDVVTDGIRASIQVGMHPAAITGGRQGSLWLADSGQGTVLCLDTVSGRVIGPPIHVARGPIRVLVSSANLWVADSGDGTVTQIDTNSRRVLHTIKIGRYPHTLTSYFCRRGDKICDPYVLWVAVWSRPRPQYQGPPGFVERIDENTAQVLP